MTGGADATWRELGFVQTGGVIVRVPADIAAAAGGIAQSFAPLETGGLLMGRYTARETVLTITVALPPPPDSMHGRINFYRGTEGLLARIAEARAADSSVFVAGEWHTHPGSAPTPSWTDTRGMRRFARRGLFGCYSPVLLILGGNLGPADLWSATVFRRWKRPQSLERSW